ncbi:MULTISPECIES: hypothetical protein [Streptomyces]|nr:MULTISPECIES: hypothetical protein [unclassified Streptomyces]MBQ1106041.1 hypothetical protein [Streptomyces sp. 404i]MBQ1116325.1 hypothetical protein [Streptomyces sp. C3-3]MDQ0693911.1 hypothetical protein [Streptomyces sp. W4I9-2]MDX3484868.1 hypothetical protein [Streptomyces sp. ID05-18]
MTVPRIPSPQWFPRQGSAVRPRSWAPNPDGVRDGPDGETLEAWLFY